MCLPTNRSCLKTYTIILVTHDIQLFSLFHYPSFSPSLSFFSPLFSFTILHFFHLSLPLLLYPLRLISLFLTLTPSLFPGPRHVCFNVGLSALSIYSDSEPEEKKIEKDGKIEERKRWRGK